MDNQVYYPQTIQDTPFPMAGASGVAATVSPSSTPQSQIPGTIPVNTNFPETYPPLQTLEQVINANTNQILGSFSFGSLGAIQIGTYEFGVSGDIRITPSGITGRDVNGATTFSIDGATGNATFKGTIEGASVIAGTVIVGNNNIILDGVNQRIIINDGTTNRVLIGYQLGGF